MSRGSLQIDDFMKKAGGRAYRKLVEHHLRRQSTSQLRLPVLGEIAELPEQLRAEATTYIDAVNDRVGHDAAF